MVSPGRNGLWMHDQLGKFGFVLKRVNDRGTLWFRHPSSLDPDAEFSFPAEPDESPRSAFSRIITEALASRGRVLDPDQQEIPLPEPIATEAPAGIRATMLELWKAAGNLTEDEIGWLLRIAQRAPTVRTTP